MILIFIFPLLFSAWATPLESKTQQLNFSLNAILDNATRPDVKPGMVVASPSKTDPNYYYDWVRDTSLTMKALVDYYEIKKDPKVRKVILNWVKSEKERQNTYALTGLGEPKFNIDGSAFMGPWGRPQNDGPALRAIAMIKWARLLQQEGQHTYIQQHLYKAELPASTIIKKDLEYTAYHWKEASFDLWEEEKGMHFYTLLAQYTALQEGAKLAQDLNDPKAAEFYESTKTSVGHYILTHFLHSNLGVLVTVHKEASLGYKDSGLDVAPLLALIHTYPSQQLIPLNHPNVKKYVRALTDNAKNIYFVNRIYPDLGVAIGRYPEDRYDGYKTSGSGNPWFLSTLALGEYHCLATNNKLMAAKQFNRVMFHSHLGHLSEQLNRETGFMQGAEDLTWSHNAFLTAMVRCGLVK